MSHVFVIAEAGVNHNGSLERAIGLIDAAHEAGADAVKFQTFKAANLVCQGTAKADYQKQTSGADENQYEMLRRLELSEADHETLIAHCQQRGIEFLSSPFDLSSLSLLTERFGLKTIKLGSGELTNAPLLLAVARTGCALILSTGMANMDEVEQALAVLAFGYLDAKSAPSMEAFAKAYDSEAGRAALKNKLTLLHCTTEYPAPYEDINLKAMDSLATAFGLPVGYSDHSEGLAISLAAVARGACVIEKHFTLDRNLPGPDHQASIEPTQLTQLVQQIRQIEAGLGDGEKRLMGAELKNRAVVRKSLITLAPIKQGEVFTEANLGIKRPGTGVAPIRYWDWLGRVAARDYAADEVINE